MRHFRKADFSSKMWSLDPSDKDQVVTEAKKIAVEGFNTVSLRKNSLGKKSIFRQSSLPEALLIRHISESIRRITSVRQSDRTAIVRSLVNLCAEGVPFKIVKMDIKSFYESVVVRDVLSSLKKDAAFSRQSIFVLESFFDALNRQGIKGLPRGIGLSATLAEYYMRGFDRTISAHNGVKYYSRYVDDCIAIMSRDVDSEVFLDFAKKHLPLGLDLNRSKTKSYNFLTSSRNSTGAVENIVRFLGYEIHIHQIVSNNNKLGREVRVDISPAKVDRIKRRLAKSFLEYNNGGSFSDLLGRIKLLTSNYGFIEDSSGMQRYAGLRYNYGLIDLNNSQSMSSLDRFLRNALMSSHPGNRIKPNISNKERNRLIGLTFKSGFEENRFFTFDNDEIHNFIRCWSHA